MFFFFFGEKAFASKLVHGKKVKPHETGVETGAAFVRLLLRVSHSETAKTHHRDIAAGDDRNITD